MNGTHLIGLALTRAEMRAQCVPRESNLVSEVILVLVIASAVLYFAAHLIVKFEDRSLIRKVRRDGFKEGE